ncbi:hypothetical protein LWI28_025803 [Acer negundo]|uniref:Fucosyltransferase n=1 Tax=Acer negundo TaxID=4023 RepID=A0AAD5IJM6_ACENE|nr:hypothetical protein LWI28_025803 [Acer negundo]
MNFYRLQILPSKGFSYANAVLMLGYWAITQNRGNCFGLQMRGNRFGMKTFSKVGAGLIAFSVVAVFIYQDTTLNSITSKSNRIGSEEESCISKNQSALYRKSSPHKPSSYLISKLRSYEELHKRCGPHSESYNRSIQQLVSGEIDNSTDCKYVVWVAFCGLGNRILSITSAFLYALLTNRVLLINQEHDMAGLFCEPFPDTLWILPEDFLFKSEISSLSRIIIILMGTC